MVSAVFDVGELQLGIGIHAGIDGEVPVRDVDLGLHGPGFEIHVAGKAHDLTGEGATQGIHANLQWVADL